MLTQVVLQSSNPMSFDIGGVDPEEILILKSISGLTPGDVTLFTGDYAGAGGYYQGRRLGQRNPVFNFKLNPDYANDVAVSDIRELLYRQFYEPQVAADGLKVLLKDDRKPDRYFIAYTDKWQGDIFTQDTSQQISTLCVDGYLRSDVVTTISVGTGVVSTPIAYEGTADTGIFAKVKVASNTSNIYLAISSTATIPNTYQVMHLQGTFVSGDIFTINTVEGQRSIQKNGVDAMGLLASGPDPWIALAHPSTTLQVYGTTPGDGVASITELSYRAAWWGA